MDKNSYLIQLSRSEDTDFGRVEFANQSEPQKVFSAIWALESEVNSGGFLHYFASWEFDTANFAPVALLAIGAESCANIVERALHSLTDSTLPNSHEACEQLVASLTDEDRKKFELLDSEFFNYPDNLTELLFEYVAAHPTTFGPVPR